MNELFQTDNKADATLELESWINDSQEIVVLTGAGMSTESGIPDFRSAGGVWEDPELLHAMTDAYLTHHPEQFWLKYKQVFLTPAYVGSAPNEGHRALQAWETEHRAVSVFTQNVDGLHQMAGSERVFELHGNARTAFCPRCHTQYDMSDILSQPVPRCRWETPKGSECDTILHPNTVLFGQAVRHLEDAVMQIGRCDLLLILGTSLTVEPVAPLPSYRSAASRLVIVNLDPTYLDDEADLVIHANIGEVLPKLRVVPSVRRQTD